MPKPNKSVRSLGGSVRTQPMPPALPAFGGTGSYSEKYNEYLDCYYLYTLACRSFQIDDMLFSRRDPATGPHYAIPYEQANQPPRVVRSRSEIPAGQEIAFRPFYPAGRPNPRDFLDPVLGSAAARSSIAVGRSRRKRANRKARKLAASLASAKAEVSLKKAETAKVKAGLTFAKVAAKAIRAKAPQRPLPGPRPPTGGPPQSGNARSRRNARRAGARASAAAKAAAPASSASAAPSGVIPTPVARALPPAGPAKAGNRRARMPPPPR